jgi:hypothetical protein
MAIDLLARWRLLQEITLKNKTGTLTVRSGPNYQHWLLRMGSVTHVQSTSPEESLTHFLRKQQAVSEGVLRKVETQIDDRHAYGFLLVKRGFMTQDAMLDALYQHRVYLASSLLQSCNHLYWSDNRLESKLHSIQAMLPLSQTLLQAERTFLELQPAVRSVEECGKRLDAVRASEARLWLTEPERRVLEYAKSGCPFDNILRDPDLDRLTCYRTIFLLWLAGHLKVRADSPPVEPEKVNASLIQRLRSVPPEWIYPFLIGMLVGTLLAPRSEPEVPIVAEPKATERLEDVMQKPAWSTPSDSAANPGGNED